MRETGPTSPDTSRVQREAEAMELVLEQICENFAEGVTAIYARIPQVKLEDQETRPELPSLDSLAYRLSHAGPGQGPDQACGLNAEQLALMFMAAADLLTSGQTELAEKAFHALTCFCPDAGLFWRGLGECQQERGDLVSALEAYRAASLLQSDDVASYVQCALLAAELQDSATLKALTAQAEQAQAEATDAEPQKALAELVTALRQIAD